MGIFRGLTPLLRIFALLHLFPVIPGCGAQVERVNLRSSPVTSASMSFGQGNSPCITGGVKLKLSDSNASLALNGDDVRGDERIQSALDSLRLRLPANITPRIESSEEVDRVSHHNVVFSFDDIAICDMGARIHVYPDRIDYTALPARHPLSGRKIDEHLLHGLVNPWPAPSAVLEGLRRHLNLISSDAVEITSTSHCAALDDARLTPLLDLRVVINGTPYEVLGDHQKIRKAARAVLFASGRASFLRDNPKTGKLDEMDLTDLADDVATLSGLRFTSSRKDDVPPIERNTREYILPQSDPSFDEVNSYANAERFSTWLQQPEKKYSLDCLPVTIELAPFIQSEIKNPDGTVRERQTTADNARYYPAQKGTGNGPRITLAPGGPKLRFLRLDFDVLAHEMGHHVLSRYLGTSPFSTVVIQEGVADFLVYAHTGDACLAESVCTEGESTGCSLPGACLRTGKNTKLIDPVDLTFTGRTEGRSPYEAAEVLSSVLWNVGSRSDVGLEKLVEIIIQAIPYLKKESSFNDLFQALYKADLQMTGGMTNCLIEEEANKRGFQEILLDIPCTDFKTR